MNFSFLMQPINLGNVSTGAYEKYKDFFSIPYFIFVRDTLSYLALLAMHLAICVQPSQISFSSLEWVISFFLLGRFFNEVKQVTVGDYVRYINFQLFFLLFFLPSTLPPSLPTYHPAFPPSFLPFLPSFLPSFPPSFLFILPSSLPSLDNYLPPSFLPPYLPTIHSTFLPSFLPSFLASFLPTFLPFVPPSFLPSFLPSSYTYYSTCL